MRAIANNSPFTDQPPWHLDFQIGVDIWATPNLKKYFVRHRGDAIRQIMKGHFSVEYFDGMLDYFSNEFHVFYLIRHPEDVLASYFRFSQNLNWLEAPEATTLSEFIRAQPEGSCLRWQRRQYPSMLSRWASHVRGWLSAATENPIHVIRYEDLFHNYVPTMKSICRTIGAESELPVGTEFTGLQPWTGGDHGELYSDADRSFIDTTVGHSILDLWDKRSTSD